MTSDMLRPAPLRFWVVAALLVFWGAAGCYACYQQFVLGANAMGPATQYDRALYASLPAWYNYAYAFATGTALIGGVALLSRLGWAGLIFLVSLIAAAVQFGYLFIATDIILKKGADVVLPFPILILAVSMFSMWFAVHAYRKSWVS